MNKNRIIAIGISFFIIFLYLLPYLILGQNAIISDWDNLDSYFIWYKTLSKYGWWLPLNFTIPEFMGGVPRNVFHSEFIFQVAIFNFLTPLKAYITIDALSRIVGFLGMYLLTKDYLLKENKNEYFICGIALCFAFIPNYLTLIFLTILGQPLLLWAFLNIRKRNYKYYNWLILTLMPCCVNFELITPFFLTIIFLIWLYDFVKKKDFNPIFLFSIFYYSIISLITIYRFIYITLFDKNFVSHRTDWVLAKMQVYTLYPFFETILNSIKTFIIKDGELCATSVNSIIMLPTALFITLFATFRKIKEVKNLYFVWAIIIIFALIFGFFSYYEPVLNLINKLNMQQFQFYRFYFMIPTFWVILFAISLQLLLQIFNQKGKYIVSCLILAQICYALYSNPYFSYSISNSKEQFTYKEYLSEDTFNGVKNYIARPQNEYKIANIDLPFNVPAYNGFRQINGYLNLYPLEQKRRLNELNKTLLETNYLARTMMVYWGHQQTIVPNEYLFSTDIMKELGAEYALSKKPIKQKNNSKLIFLKVFPSKAYNIYLYKIK